MIINNNMNTNVGYVFYNQTVPPVIQSVTQPIVQPNSIIPPPVNQPITSPFMQPSQVLNPINVMQPPQGFVGMMG